MVTGMVFHTGWKKVAESILVYSLMSRCRVRRSGGRRAGGAPPWPFSFPPILPVGRARPARESSRLYLPGPRRATPSNGENSPSAPPPPPDMSRRKVPIAGRVEPDGPSACPRPSERTWVRPVPLDIATSEQLRSTKTGAKPDHGLRPRFRRGAFAANFKPTLAEPAGDRDCFDLLPSRLNGPGSEKVAILEVGRADHPSDLSRRTCPVGKKTAMRGGVHARPGSFAADDDA